MALLTSELDRIKYELGFNVLNVGAEPFIGVAAIFEQVIQPYLRSGATTTSSTSVSAATVATPVALTLASVTGVSAGDRLVIDVDARQEFATVQSVSGSTVSVLLTGVHSGVYPVTVESGEAIVRSLLRRLRAIQTAIDDASGSAGLKRVDEIEFFGGESAGKDMFSQLTKQQTYWRGELYRVLFGYNGNRGGSGLSVY